MGSLKKAGKLGMRRSMKSVGRVTGASGRKAMASSTIAASVGSVKRHTGIESRVITKAEQVWHKLGQSQNKAKKVISGVKRAAVSGGLGAGLVGGITAFKSMRGKKNKNQFVRRTK